MKKYIKKKRIFNKPPTASAYDIEVLRAFSKRSFFKFDKRKEKKKVILWNSYEVSYLKK